jgi:UDP-N-acetylmuramyl tripeptide synthase
MELKKVLALRGANVWANFPVLEAWLDVSSGRRKEEGGRRKEGEKPRNPSAFLLPPSCLDVRPGFIERLTAWLPGLSKATEFLERLRESTAPGYALAHVCLELERLAGTEVRFGCVRETATAVVSRVVVEYQDEQLARAARDRGARLCLAAGRDERFDVAGEVEKLRGLYRRLAPKPETVAFVQAARRRGIPVRFMNTDGLVQLGYGARQHRLLGAQTDGTSATAESIARDNHLSRALLQTVGVPVAPAVTVTTAEAAWEEAQDLGLPVSVRPRYGKDCAEWARLETQEQVLAAYHTSSTVAPEPVLVERAVPGVEHHILVVGSQAVAAVRREGGRCVEVTPRLHPEVAARAAEAARVVGLDVAGVEVTAADIGQPLEEQGGAVLAVRAQPDLAEFLKPDEGEPQPIADAILATLFPEGDNGRVPVVAITGTNGKTTTTRLIAHVLGRTCAPVGMACSEGIYLGDRLLEAGDCSGPKSARAVLGHPEARAAVLETARGGILREGLGFDHCHVAVVTNVGKADHLGLQDIHTPEQVARVKRTLVEAVLPGSRVQSPESRAGAVQAAGSGAGPRTGDPSGSGLWTLDSGLPGPGGAAVLNAADPLVAAMAEHCPGMVIFFARAAQHPVIVAHRAAGKRAAFVRDGQIVLAVGATETTLVPLDRVPLTHGGQVGFNVDNALAAVAAAWAIGLPFAEIRAGLETFRSVLKQSPGRFNLLEYRGATVVMDYAHNISALESFLEVLPQFPHVRRSVVYAVPGDRTDDVIITQGELLAAAYDRVILYEDTELRGRPEGTIFTLMRRGLARGGRVRKILDVRGNLKAIEMALATVEPGELLVIQPEFPDIGAEYLARLTDAGAREVTLDRACACAAVVPADVG